MEIASEELKQQLGARAFCIHVIGWQIFAEMQRIMKIRVRSVMRYRAADLIAKRMLDYHRVNIKK